jgi:four helix bundle protein
MFVALPKTDEARVVGKQGLRWGTSVGANCQEAHRSRSRFKAECISKIGDGLEGLNETVYWLELLTVFRIVSSPKQTSLQDETNQPLVILTMLGAFDLGVLGELGASRFPGRKWVRAKDAKDAKVRKGDR